MHYFHARCSLPATRCPLLGPTPPQDEDGESRSTDPTNGSAPHVPYSQWAQPRFVHNASGRFESRWSSVAVLPSPAVLLRGMEGSVLGVWVAHGEGRAHFPCDKVRGEARRG